jgi:transcriptional regulator with XRE-family HTH domain
MEWGADRILALRKHAGMTQAQVAQWLGVTIKQVKYLEHHRRNPSGPTRRLLNILAAELNFDGGSPVQVLGASAVIKGASQHTAPGATFSSANHGQPKPVLNTTVIELANEEPSAQPEPNADQPSDGGAFVWR